MSTLDMVSSFDGTPDQYAQFKCPGCGGMHCLGDCTHALAGQTVDIPKVPEGGL